MLFLETIAETRTACASIHAAGKTLGLVPTMGALHRGHISLVQAARSSCDVAPVSVTPSPIEIPPISIGWFSCQFGVSSVYPAVLALATLLATVLKAA